MLLPEKQAPLFSDQPTTPKACCPLNRGGRLALRTSWGARGTLRGGHAWPSALAEGQLHKRQTPEAAGPSSDVPGAPPRSWEGMEDGQRGRDPQSSKAR